LVARRLIEAGFRVMLLDKRRPVGGSTQASTALLSYETDKGLVELSRLHGARAARIAYSLGRAAVGEIGRIARDLGIDCGFRKTPTLYLASDRRGWTLLRAEYAARRRAGIAVTRLSRAQLAKRFGLKRPGALYSVDSAQMDPVRFTRGVLAQAVASRRLRIASPETVTAVVQKRKRVELRTRRGFRVRAKHVVIATGYESAPFLPDGWVDLRSTYVVASAPMSTRDLWREECLIWETARPYLYLRATDDRRVIVGGEDEPFADDATRDRRLLAKRRKLIAHVRKLFPSMPFEPEFAWVGTFGETPDGLPLIGAKAGEPRILYALGYGGNGITFSQIAAKIITDHCQGRRNAAAAVFRMNRLA
jgi:glycine/D-amino acid oxidase-like deaminating enzyme